MKKGLFLILMLTIAGIFISSGIITAADSQDKMIIDGKSYKKDIKGPVSFEHAKHNKEYGVSCDECHHVYQDGANTWKEGDPVKKCGECHDPDKKEGNVKKLMMAFHGNCKDCHKKMAKEQGKNAPYKKCEDCHAK